MTPPREPQSAEEVLSVLAMAARGAERLDARKITKPEVDRIRALISKLDDTVVRKWRA